MATLRDRLRRRLLGLSASGTMLQGGAELTRRLRGAPQPTLMGSRQRGRTTESVQDTRGVLNPPMSIRPEPTIAEAARPTLEPPPLPQDNLTQRSSEIRRAGQRGRVGPRGLLEAGFEPLG